METELKSVLEDLGVARVLLSHASQPTSPNYLGGATSTLTGGSRVQIPGDGLHKSAFRGSLRGTGRGTPAERAGCIRVLGNAVDLRSFRKLS